jgi:hypothetical protein
MRNLLSFVKHSPSTVLLSLWAINYSSTTNNQEAHKLFHALVCHMRVCAHAHTRTTSVHSIGRSLWQHHTSVWNTLDTIVSHTADTPPSDFNRVPHVSNESAGSTNKQTNKAMTDEGLSHQVTLLENAKSVFDATRDSLVRAIREQLRACSATATESVDDGATDHLFSGANRDLGVLRSS